LCKKNIAITLFLNYLGLNSMNLICEIVKTKIKSSEREFIIIIIIIIVVVVVTGSSNA
jgi:hypothetical protein